MRSVLLSILLSIAVSITTDRAGAQTAAQERLYESLRRELTDRLQASGRFSSISAANRSTLKAKLLNGTEMSIALEAVATDIAQKPSQRTDILVRFAQRTIASVEQPKALTSRADFIASLRPMIRPKDYLPALAPPAAARGDPLNSPLWRPLAGDILVLIAIVNGEQIDFARPGAGQRHGISDDDLFELGREQLKRFLPDLETEDASGVRAFTLPDEVTSPSLLLVDEAWSKVEIDFGAGFLVAVPDRNTLFAAAAKDAAQLRKAVVLLARSRKSTPMISDLLQRKGNGWIVFGSR